MILKHRWVGLFQVLPGLEVFPDIYLMALKMVNLITLWMTPKVDDSLR